VGEDARRSEAEPSHFQFNLEFLRATGPVKKRNGGARCILYCSDVMEAILWLNMVERRNGYPEWTLCTVTQTFDPVLVGWGTRMH
jgi:hypothetical protein